MTAVVTRRRTAADLRDEEAQLEHALDRAEAEWRFVLEDDGPVAFERRGPLAAEIRRLQQRLSEFAEAIPRAEKQDAARDSLHALGYRLRLAAEQQVVDVVAAIEALTRELFIETMRTCAASNATRSILVADAPELEAQLPRPLDARREITGALEDALRRLRLIVPAACRPDDSPWRSALAVLRDGGYPEGGHHDDAA